MSKLLIALLALDIGVSLSKVFIFTWNQISIQKRSTCCLKQEIDTGYYLFDFFIL